MPRIATPKPFHPVILFNPSTDADRLAERMVWAMHSEVSETMNTERNAQQEIGISEIGTDCMKCLARHLSLLFFIESPSWKAQVGTFGHAGIESWLRQRYQLGDPLTIRTDHRGIEATRYLREVDPNVQIHLEEELSLPLPDGSWIPGHGDMFIEGVIYGIVWDHKFLGPKPLAEKAKGHLGNVYDTQLDGYGLAYEMKGKRVTHVALGALPRDGQIQEAAFVLRPYNRQRAIDRLALIVSLKESAALVGWEAVIEAQPRDPACWDCPRFEAAEESNFFAGFQKQ